MIVISSALALTAAHRANAWKPTIGWHNLVSVDTIAADSEDADYPATNLANPSTAPLQGWRSESTAVQYVTVTYDYAGEIDYVAVAGHNWGSAGIEVTVETLSADEDAVWAEAVAAQFLADDSPAIFQFSPAFGAAVRFKLDPSGADVPVAPKAAVIHAGKLIVMDCGIPPGHTPISYAGEQQSVDNQAQDGGYLGSVILSESHATSVDFRDIDPAWYRGDLEPFRSAGKGTTFFLCEFPASYPDEVGYCWLTNSPKPVINRSTGEIDISLQISAVVS